jgi:hypothetical protein
MVRGWRFFALAFANIAAAIVLALPAFAREQGSVGSAT